MVIIAKYSLNGNANNSVGTNGVETDVSWVAGKSGMAGSFVLNNAEINCGAIYSLGTGNFSISFFIKTNTINISTDNDVYIYNKRWGGVNSRIFIRNSLGKLNVYTEDQNIGAAQFGTFNLQSNTLYYIVFVRIGSTGYFYINGVFYESGTIRPSNLGGATNWQIGNLYDGTSRFPANAMIDEVEVHNTALTPAEVKNKYLYYNGFM